MAWGSGLDWSDAERVTRNNMYVFTIEPATSSTALRCARDALDFREPIASRRAGSVLLGGAASTATIFGFALWWECTLAPGVVLSTSPYAARTHWDQIYLPLLEPVAVGSRRRTRRSSSRPETGGDESGIDVRWGVRFARGGVCLPEQKLSIGDGFPRRSGSGLICIRALFSPNISDLALTRNFHGKERHCYHQFQKSHS